MKILFVSTGHVDDDSRLLKESAALQAAGHDVTILGWREEPHGRMTTDTFEFDGQKLKAIFTGIKLSYSFKYFKVLAFIRFEAFLYRWLRKHLHEYDAVQACNVHTGYVTAKVVKKTKTKFVYDIFDYAPDTRNYPEWYRKMVVHWENVTMATADWTLICSEDRRRQIEPAKPKNLAVIYNSPLDSSVAADAEVINPKQTSFRIVYIGGLSPYRCLPELFGAVENNPALSLTVAGQGQFQNMFADAAKRDQRIDYLGVVPYEKVNGIEKTADILVALYDPVLKNHLYASPNKFFEAMELGKPLLMIKRSGMSNWLTKYGFGAVCEPSESGIAAGLQELVDKRQDWAKEAVLMRQIYQKEFAWPLMQQRLRRIYASFETK